MNYRQKVMLRDKVSDWTPVVSGVPQGSVLGPTLFVNDLPDDIITSCKIFVDDTKVIAEIRPNFEAQDKLKLQKDIDRVVEWCKFWHMTLNTAKCTIINPYVKKDVKTLEKVQIRVTKITRFLRNLTNDERLQNLNITSSEVRWERGNLIEL